MEETKRRIRVVAAIIVRDGRYLITQRRPTAVLPLLWEFPGGRADEGETDEAALERELGEEMGIRVRVGERAIHVEHSYVDYDIDFRVYRCDLVEGEVRHIGVHDHKWVQPSELEHFEFPAADERSMKALLALD